MLYVKTFLLNTLNVTSFLITLVIKPYVTLVGDASCGISNGLWLTKSDVDSQLVVNR